MLEWREHSYEPEWYGISGKEHVATVSYAGWEEAPDDAELEFCMLPISRAEV